jgi:hypothetical protein
MDEYVSSKVCVHAARGLVRATQSRWPMPSPVLRSCWVADVWCSRVYKARGAARWLNAVRGGCRPSEAL